MQGRFVLRACVRNRGATVVPRVVANAKVPPHRWVLPRVRRAHAQPCGRPWTAWGYGRCVQYEQAWAWGEWIGESTRGAAEMDGPGSWAAPGLHTQSVG
jgi:hypothetical protein